MRLLRRYRALSLRWKIPLAMTVTVYVVALIIAGMVMAFQWRQMEDAIQDQIRQLTQTMAHLMQPHLARNEYWEAFADIQRLVSQAPDAWQVRTVVLDSLGKVFVSNLPREYPIQSTVEEADWLADGVRLERWDEVILAGAPVIQQNIEIGGVLMTVSVHAMFSAWRRLMLEVLAAVVVIALLGGVMGAWLSRRMAEPLNAMARAVPMIEQGRYHDLPLIPVRDEDEIGRLAHLFNKMREELLARVQMDRQIARAERLSALGRLAVAAAHEIRNPLGGVINSLHTLKVGAYDPKVRQHCLETMHMGLQQIEHIVKAMLGYSRESAEEDGFTPQRLGEIEALLSVSAHERGVDVHYTWRTGEPLSLPGSPMNQLILNLTMNAIEASPPGARVRVALSEEADEAVLSVTDQGGGIAEEIKEHIFEPFWSDKGGGTGLGLWVCARIVNELGGTIFVESEPGAGTLVEVRLPMLQPLKLAVAGASGRGAHG